MNNNKDDDILKLINNNYNNNKIFVDNNNDIVLRTNDSLFEDIGYIDDLLTKEHKYIYKINSGKNDTVYKHYYDEDNYYLDYVGSESFIKEYTYYDLKGNIIHFNGINKIDYVINEYIFELISNYQEMPYMIMFNTKTNEIKQLEYNQILYIEPYIIFNLNTWENFIKVKIEPTIANDDDFLKYFSKGNEKCIIYDKNFNIIKKIDGYNIECKFKYNNKYLYRLFYKRNYVPMFSYYANYSGSNCINFMDENFNLMLDEAIYQDGDINILKYSLDTNSIINENDSIYTVRSNNNLFKIDFNNFEIIETIKTSSNKIVEGDIYSILELKNETLKLYMKDDQYAVLDDDNNLISPYFDYTLYLLNYADNRDECIFSYFYESDKKDKYELIPNYNNISFSLYNNNIYWFDYYFLNYGYYVVNNNLYNIFDNTKSIMTINDSDISDKYNIKINVIKIFNNIYILKTNNDENKTYNIYNEKGELLYEDVNMYIDNLNYFSNSDYSYDIVNNAKNIYIVKNNITYIYDNNNNLIKELNINALRVNQLNINDNIYYSIQYKKLIKQQDEQIKYFYSLYDDNYNLIYDNILNVNIVNNYIDIVYDENIKEHKLYDEKLVYIKSIYGEGYINSFERFDKTFYYVYINYVNYKNNIYDENFNIIFENVTYNNYYNTDYLIITYDNKTEIYDEDLKNISTINKSIKLNFQINDEYMIFQDNINNRYGILKNMKDIIIYDYKSISDLTKNYFTYQQGFKYGLMDYNLNKICEFSIFDNFSDNFKEEY